MTKRRLIYLIFFFSGAAGLMYEVLWSRMLSLTFGSSVYAVTAVLSAYMAGLALGSYLFGNLASRSSRPLRIYGLLELGVGVSALLTPFAFNLIKRVHSFLLEANLSLSYSLLVRFLLAFIVLVIPTIFMGGTLPVISEHIVRHRKETGRGVGTLYSVNTLGAVLGAGFTGLWLIGVIGIHKTLLIAVTLNSLIFFVILGLFWNEKVRKKRIQEVPHPRKKTVFHISPSWIIIGYGISGFVALAYEVVWTRILILYLFNGTYSFTIMLISFLIGIGLGSLLIRKRVDSLKNPVKTFGLLEVLLGIFTLFVFFSFSHLKDLLLFLQKSIGYGWWSIIGFSVILSFLVMFLPTLIMGAIFPVVTKAYRELSGETTAKSVGGIYASNTFGTVLGSLVAGLVLIHLLGALTTHLTLVAMNFIIGAFFLVVTVRKNRRTLVAFVTFVLLFFTFVGLKKASETKLHPMISSPEGPKPSLIFYGEGPAATVTVFRYPRGQRSAYVNGTFIISDSYDALKTVKLLGHLPALFAEGPLRKALVIGFGMGVTTSELLFYPFREIQCVEIAPEVLRAAYLFRDLNREAYNNPRVRIYIEDGRNFIERSHDLYDVITVDPTHPVLGSGPLYTEEFYRDCRRHLTEGGVMAQYLPLHLMSQKNFRSLIRTFSSVFPYTTLWLGQTHVIMIGGKKPLNLSLSDLNSVFGKQDVKESLMGVDLGDPINLLAHFVTDWEGVKEIAIGGHLSKDDRPFVEFIKPESVKRENWPLNMLILLEAFSPPLKLLDLRGFESQDFLRHLKKVLSARKLAYKGMVSYGFNRKKEAVNLFEEALKESPDDPMIKRLLDLARRHIYK